jgi:hypothetical protein
METITLVAFLSVLTTDQLVQDRLGQEHPAPNTGMLVLSWMDLTASLTRGVRHNGNRLAYQGPHINNEGDEVAVDAAARGEPPGPACIIVSFSWQQSSNT